MRAGTLSDCSNEGTVGSEYTGGSYVGGVVGRMDGGRIENCFNGFENLDPDDGASPPLERRERPRRAWRATPRPEEARRSP